MPKSDKSQCWVNGCRGTASVATPDMPGKPTLCEVCAEAMNFTAETREESA